MTPLESKIATLLVDCESTLKPYTMTAGRWQIKSKSETQLETIVDEKTSLAISYGKSFEEIKKLKSYNIANKAFERDKVFANSNITAGMWGAFNGVLEYILTSTCKLTTSKIVFNHSAALLQLRKLRELFTKKHINYIATTRLIGATTTSKRITLPDEVEILRLNAKEINDRQPLIHSHLTNGTHYINLADNNLELSLPITVPVDHSKEHALFIARNEAESNARTIFGNILDAILVAISGKAMLTAIELHGGIEQMSAFKSIPNEVPLLTNITIAKSDISNINAAYDLISGGKKGDKTLSRALHRFLLGRKRTDLVDKLVDYVIAWEALLLTQDGSPITQELSYRFSINGASILNTVDRKLDRFMNIKQLKAAYSVRSIIVHGGGDADINRLLHKGSFNNLHSLCDFLEDNFRKTIIWLAKKDVKNRPYRKEYGWEKLIWLGE